MKKLRMAIALVCFLAGSAGAVTSEQDPQALTDAITRFLQDQTRQFGGTASITVGEWDSRWNLAACPAPEVFVPPGGRILGNGRVGVRCAHPREGAGWTIYVPVQVSLHTTLLVARKSLASEQVLTGDDVALQDGEVTRPGALTDPAQAIGKVLKQGVAPGQVIRQDMVREPYAIRQGQTVQVQVAGEGFKVSSEGQAMNSAVEGQSLQVRTVSGKMVTGIAAPGGMVRVSP